MRSIAKNGRSWHACRFGPEVQGDDGLESFASGGGAPGEEDDRLFEGILGISDVDASDQYLVNYQTAMRVWQELSNQSETPIPMKMEAQQVTVNGLEGLRITIDMEGMLKAQNAPPQSRQMIEQMFGNGGKITTHVIAADANTILLSYASAESIEEVMVAYRNNKSRLADETGIPKIASLLGQNPDMVAYLSPSGIVGWISRLMGGVLPPGVEIPEIPQFPKTLPVGFSAKIVTGGFETELVVPARLPRVVKEFIPSIRQ
ncbi:MAG: hypothetical protein ABGX16_23325 [Pirellulales bacterium]